MGVPVLALFRENKIRESQYYCHSRNLNPSKFMPYTVSSRATDSCQHSFILCQVSTLTDDGSNCIQFLLRSAHDDNIETLTSKLSRE